MTLLEPQPTPFDLKWTMFGIPVRVHPMFWAMGAFLGWPYMNWGFSYLLAWMGCMFLSILVHELGHVVMGRVAGKSSRIVLYSFGGLAIGDFPSAKRWQRIAIALAGPAAGFLLLGLVLIGKFYLQKADPIMANRVAWRAIGMLVFMNFFWNVFNLLPIFPLDGGQVVREIATGVSKTHGLMVATAISFLLAAAVAIYSFNKWRNPDLWYPPVDPVFAMLMFSMLALQSFFQLQSLAKPQRPYDQDY